MQNFTAITIYLWYLCSFADTSRFQYRWLAYATGSHCKTREDCSACWYFLSSRSHCHIVQLSPFRGRRFTNTLRVCV